MITKSLKPLVLGIFTLSVTILIAQFFRDELAFHRVAIEHGQWWLILSGNIVHSNYPHLFLNLAGLWVLGFIVFDYLSLKTFIVSTLFLCASVGLGLYFFNPELQKYYGLSGALYGLFLVGATTAFLARDLFTGVSVAFFIIAKVTWDLIYGGSSSSAELIGVPVAVDAHLYGIIGAIVVSFWLYFMRLRKE